MQQHIQLFEDFIKKYGQTISKEDFENIKPGSYVLYSGTSYEVVQNNRVTLVIKSPETGDAKSINYSMFNQNGAIDEALSNAFLNEGDDDDKQSTDRGPIDNDAVEKGLKNKSEETGVPIGILRAVMRRGMAAWKSGHRPGAGQEQWGYARVNSFLTKGKGTWGKADADLAKEVRDGGHDSKL